MTEDLLLAAIYGVSSPVLGLARLPGGDRPGYGYGRPVGARFFPTSVGQALLIVDGMAIVLAYIAFGLNYVRLDCSLHHHKTVDVVQEGQTMLKHA